MTLETGSMAPKDSIQVELTNLKAEMAENKKRQAEIQARIEAIENSLSSSTSRTTESVPDGKMVTHSVTTGDVSGIDKLYGWGRGEAIKPEDVKSVVNNLPEPYNGEVSSIIQSKDIRRLQRYLNQKINNGEINSANLARALASKGIPFPGYIEVDNKFGPQTLETLKFFVKQKQEPRKPDNPEEPRDNPEGSRESREKESNIDWIKEETLKVIDDFRDGATDDGRWHREREASDGNEICTVDTERKRVRLDTWHRPLEGTEYQSNEDNRCELDWTTGDIYVICNKDSYKMPVSVNRLELDAKGYPKDCVENRDRIRAFAEVGNLMNMLKINYVFNGGKHSFEFKGGDIEYNDSRLLVLDTDIVDGKVFSRLNDKYRSTGLNFTNEAKRSMACLLNAMKLDTDNLSEEDLKEGCTADDVTLSKSLSKRHRS